MERKIAFQAKGAAWAKASENVVLRRVTRDEAERWAHARGGVLGGCA